MKRTDFINYIKEELGAPVINIEVTDKQIENQIDKAVQKFTEYSFGCDYVRYIKFKCEGSGTYNVDNRIKSISKISKGSNFFTKGMNYIPTSYINMFHSGATSGPLGMLINISGVKGTIDHFFYDSINYDYDEFKKKLIIYENYHGNLLIEAYTEYIPDEDDGVYDQIWVKSYAVELTRLLWASNVGKYSQSLVGGASINYADIKSQAESNIDKLEDELLDKWSDIPPIYIG